MHNAFNSLRLRLILLMVLMLLVTSGLAALFAYLVVNAQMDQFIAAQAQIEQHRQERLEAMLPPVLAAYYDRKLSWDDINSVFGSIGELTEQRLILADQSGSIVLDSAYLSAGRQVADSSIGYIIPIRNSNRTVGEVRVVPASESRQLAELQQLITSIRRSLLWALTIAIPSAIVLTAVFTRRLLNPVKALTDAAKRIEQGDLNQRVEPQTSDEIGELASAFNAMADSRLRNDQLRRQLVTDVAHELRTPLSNIRGYLEAVQDNVIEPSETLIDSLYEEVMLLNHLVDDLQELALAEGGQLKMARQPAPLNHLVKQAHQMIQPRVQAQQIEFALKLPHKSPVVDVDAERIGQVLRNLLGNALTHTPRQGQITVEVLPAGDEAKVCITNSGPGIPPEHLPYIFERFYRVDSSRTRSTGGSGLGLAIVKQLVEAHGGTIRVESEVERETLFLFTLPVGSNE
ncbi:MAG: ATP-binding protein [Caldilineaceae bacterium]